MKAHNKYGISYKDLYNEACALIMLNTDIYNNITAVKSQCIRNVARRKNHKTKICNSSE